jgi:hypothetical protein
MNSTTKSFFFGFLTAILIISLIIWFIPAMEDFHSLNTDWSGFSKATTGLNLTLVEDLDTIVESQALLIVGPSKQFENKTIERLKHHLELGGLIIVADDFGSGNQLLEGLEVNIKIDGSLLLDPLIKHKGRVLPKAIFKDSEIVLNHGSIIEGEGFQVLAESSRFSFLDLNLNMILDKEEPSSSFPVAVRLQLEKGTIIVISDSSILINSMIELEENKAFLKSIVGDRDLLVDTSHWIASPFTEIKMSFGIILQFLNRIEIKYLIITSLVVMILNLKINDKTEQTQSLKEILEKHPDWDENILMKLKSDMEREDEVVD